MEEMNKARELYSKSLSESVLDRHSKRLVTIQVPISVPGLETVVFEGINGCGKDYLYNLLNEKFKEELDIELPLFSSKPPLEELQNLKEFLEIKEEGEDVNNVMKLARVFLNQMSKVSFNVRDINITHSDWCKKAFDQFVVNSYNPDRGFIESKPTTKYVAVMRWTLSNYIYCIQSLIGTKEMERLVDKYYESNSETNSSGFKSGLTLESINEVDWNTPQPIFLYELISNPKVIEFTRRWANAVSSRKVTMQKEMELLPMDNLVYILTSPELAMERISSRDKVDIPTDSHKLTSLRFTYLLFNALFYCVFFRGHDDEYLDGTDNLREDIRDQIWTILDKKDRVEYSDEYIGYSYQLTETIQLLRGMFDVDNINICVAFHEDKDDSEVVINRLFNHIILKERKEKHSGRTMPSLVRGRV